MKIPRWMTKRSVPTVLGLVLIMVIALAGKASLPPAIAQTSSTTTVYLDPPTINGTVIGEEFTVNISIRDGLEVVNFGVGLNFNPTLLECTGFFKGEFLDSKGLTLWIPGLINNTTGKIRPCACALLESQAPGSDEGRLAYLTFEVKAPGVSDLHTSDLKVFDISGLVAANIIDVFTVVLNTTSHTVVTVSNSTYATAQYHSGFYDHAFSLPDKEVSFKVSGPFAGFANVTIPKTLLNVTNLDDWIIIIDGSPLNTEERTVTENTTHYSIYFTYSFGIHEIKITVRMLSAISIALSSPSISLGSNVTISGNITANDPINPLRPNVNVTIQYRPIGAETWNTIDIVKTDSNASYNYTWTPETGGTHEVMASWEGDEETIGDESDVLTLAVLYVFEPVQDVHVIVETNSTVSEFNSISAFNFSQPLKQISFNVTSPYGTLGFSNVTIPKTLLNVSTLEEWQVIRDDDYDKPVNRTVTPSATHHSIYFTYDTGNHTVKIVIRLLSTISIALSSPSISLGSNVTISGNITANDPINPLRPNVNVTIQYKLNDGNLTTLDTVLTDQNSNYTYVWTPTTAGTYEVMTSWEGDEATLLDESDVLTLAVMVNSTISIALSPTNIPFGSSVTISGSIEPLRPEVQVYIQYKLVSEMSFHGAGQNQTEQDSSYTFTWTPDTPGTYEVRVLWLGNDITYNATSNVLTLTAMVNSTVSIALSSTNITHGENVTISGDIDPVRENANVQILYRLSGATEWTSLANVVTDQNSNYTYVWTPTTAGTYEVKALWDGNEETLGDESDSPYPTLTVEEELPPAGIDPYVVVAVVVPIIIVAAIVVYFVKFRKPR